MQIPIDRNLVVHLLEKWGYITTPNPTDAEITAAITEYQVRSGVPGTGVVDLPTLHQITNPLRCGMPDKMAGEEQVCAWPMKEVKVYPRLAYGSPLPSGLSQSSILASVKAACESWNAVCGVELVLVTEISVTNILCDFGTGSADNLDGPGGTLAWSYMPCGSRSNTTLQQKYDWRERWTTNMLQAVVAHEVGHAIGLPHLTAGALLAPYYNSAILVPQQADIVEAVKRYGQPKSKPPKPDGPGNAPGTPVVQMLSIEVKQGQPIVRMLRVAVDGVEYETASDGPMRRSVQV